MTEQSAKPTEDSIQNLLDIIYPTASDFSIQELTGSYSNFTNLVNVEFSDQETKSIVVRRYNTAHSGTAEKPVREYKALELLQQHDVPVPKPLYLDVDGSILGSAGIVTEFVKGNQIEPPTHAADWGNAVEKNAIMLAKIHAVPYTDDIKPFLMDDTVEVAWFIKSGEIPEYMQADPDGEMVWHLVNDHIKKRESAESVLCHTDYWSGNILWYEGEISAVVDWEETAHGERGMDVAYARMEYYLEGLPDATETFLNVYEKQIGHPMKNLALWELAASARPMTDPSGWFTRPHMEDRFRSFIASAKQRLTS